MNFKDKIFILFSSQRITKDKCIRMNFYSLSRGFDYFYYYLILPITAFFLIGGVFTILIAGLITFLLIKLIIFYTFGVKDS